MSQERRLMRRLERQGGNVQARGGLYLPQGVYTPQDEQDGKRDRLAERLLEIGLENLSLFDFADAAPQVVKDEPPQQQVTVAEWYRKLAHAALAAAEVIYPEIPEAGESEVDRFQRENRVYPVPAPAITGAEAILGKAVDAYLNDPRVGLHPIAPRPSEEEEA